MTDIRDLFLTAADGAAGLLAGPEVADAWDEPSALDRLSVRGLAGHLAGQILFVSQALDGPEAAEETIGIHAYYARAAWIGSDLDDEFNQGIRAKGEKDAADGPRALAERAATAVAALRVALPDAPSRRVRRAGWPFSLTLDDFVTSRLLEITVHSDDLACSVGVPTPELPAEAVETVVDLLSRIAIRRHGAVEVLRGLSRAERAPASISAL
ncbi:maleylpyruvate isomerase N-terminal domain-containing protein [Actinoallomurus sp. CA-142502]|uniref:maleylpyruvate isomerase N-terminal domain-containing protein n=1 Tax=Actinoallomurus sp. CA-142502 TaxID=3239885 RepID=UPI003D8AA4C3